MAEQIDTTDEPSIVWLRGRGKCGRRKNRPEDARTIQTRRLLARATALGDENATALAISWAMERELPCKNLRLIVGTLDQRTDFQVRLQDLEIARAERQLHDAKRWRTRLLHGEDGAFAMNADGERLFERYREAMLDMATTPIFTGADLARKKRAIGTVWLKAEGEWFERLRAAVAADDARLKTKGTGAWVS